MSTRSTSIRVATASGSRSDDRRRARLREHIGGLERDARHYRGALSLLVGVPTALAIVLRYAPPDIAEALLTFLSAFWA